MRHPIPVARRCGATIAAFVFAATLAVAPAAAAAPRASSSAAVSSAAASASLGLALEVVSDGNTFTPDLPQQPGGDQNSHNGIVRTGDVITYRVDANSLQGTATNETFTVAAPDHTTWTTLPQACKPEGSSLTDHVLTCNLGTLEGHTAAVAVVLAVDESAANGQVVRVAGSVHSDEEPVATPSVTSAAVKVSAAPRYDLAKNLVSNLWNADATGPGGQKGISITYPVTIAWRPLAEGQGTIGAERLTGDLTFDDDVSKMTGGLTSTAQLMTNAANGGCGPNDGVFTTLPGSKGGGHRNVVDSGTLSCSQSAPGAPVHMTVKGIDTSLSSIPDQGVNGKPIEAGPAAYVAQFVITLWLPMPQAGTPIESVNTFTALQAASISGQENYPGAGEPLANNSSRRTISLAASGGGYKVYGRVLADGSVVQDSGKKGDPWVTPGTVVRSQVNLRNDSVGAATGAIVCDVFDNSGQHLTRGPARDPVFARSDGPAGSRLEYAASTFTTPQAARDATCDDSDGPWYSSPTDVPGGIDAVGRVRVVSDVPGSGQRNLFLYLQVRPGADGNRLRNFGQLFFGTAAGWSHDKSSADISAGGLSDFLLRTADLARVTQVAVAPGTPVDSTNPSIDSALPGDSVEFQLFPSLSNATEGAAAQDVTLVDVLPAHTTYMAGSASIPPVVDSFVDSDGIARQRLTWVFHGVEPDTAVTPVTFRAQIVPGTLPGPIVNDATVSSPGDVSDESLRHAARSLRVTASGKAGALKSAVDPVVVSGDSLRWTIEAHDDGNTVLEKVDMIDVLPWHGDKASSFHGSVRLAAPPIVDSAAGETLLYTDAEPSSVSRLAGDPSNQPGGSTTWCAESDFGRPDCPTGLADVTAVRIQQSQPIAVGGHTSHEVVLSTAGQQNGDVYSNVVGLQTPSFRLPAESQPATIEVMAGSIGETVWWDANKDGLRQPTEKLAAGVAVRLSGASDLGAVVDATTKTDANGRYRFDGLRPGSYAVTFTAPDGASWTKKLVGADATLASAVDAHGVATKRLQRIENEGRLVGVERTETVNAGLVAADTSPGPSPSPTATPTPGPGGVTIPDKPDGHGVDGAGGGSDGSSAAGGVDGGHVRPAASGGQAGPLELAFTGGRLPLGVMVVGLAALASGVVVLVLRRRRRRA